MHLCFTRKCTVAPLQNYGTTICHALIFENGRQDTQPSYPYLVSYAIYNLVHVGGVAPLRKDKNQMHNAGLVLPVVDESSMASFGLFFRIFYREVLLCGVCHKFWCSSLNEKESVFCFYFYRTFVFLPRARRSVLFLRRRPKLIKNNKTQYWQEDIQFVQQEDTPTLCTLQNLIEKVHLARRVNCTVAPYISIFQL